MSNYDMGASLRRLMAERKITQAEMADRLNIIPQQVHRYLTYKDIKTEVAQEFADILHVPISELIKIAAVGGNFRVE